MVSEIWMRKLVSIFVSLVMVFGSVGINIPISYASSEETNIKNDVLISDENVEDTLQISNSAEITTSQILSVKSQDCFASGSGTEQEPYEIFNKQDLIFLSDRVNSGDSKYNDKYYKLMNDISLEGLDWIPIGTKSNPFSGSFDGSECSINNIHIKANCDILEYIGFFGYIKQGCVSNLRISDFYFKLKINKIPTQKFIGALAGYIYGGNTMSLIDGHIKNVRISKVNIILNKNPELGYLNVGGVVGAYNYGDIKNCYADTTIKVNEKETGLIENVYVGGFVAENEGFIENSASKVIGLDILKESFGQGTFCGYNIRGYIINCYSSRACDSYDNIKGAMTGHIASGGAKYVYADSVKKIVKSHGIDKPDVSDSEIIDYDEIKNGKLLAKLNKNIETKKNQILGILGSYLKLLFQSHTKHH